MGQNKSGRGKNPRRFALFTLLEIWREVHAAGLPRGMHSASGEAEYHHDVTGPGPGAAWPASP